MIIYSQKYYNKYNQIVKHYKDLNLKKSKELYTESHHIVPKSMGGNNSKENLVRVPARVHFLLHWMLYRIYRTPGMAYAWHMLSRNNENLQRINSKSYEYARNAISNSITGKNNPMYGKSHTVETKLKISKVSKLTWLGKTHTDETKLKMSEKAKHRPKISEETRQKLQLSAKNRKIINCPYCNISGQPGTLYRWHFNNCKRKLQ